jgi:ferrous iron transport protein B
MIISLGMGYGAWTVLAALGSLGLIAIATNVALNAIMKGEGSEFFAEIPAYRVPKISLLLGRLWSRVAAYFAEVLPMIAAGVLVLNVLDALGVIAFLTEASKAPIRILFGLPEGIAPVLILGFLRKDVSIALLAPLGLSAGQFVTASVFLALYTPCVAAFFTLIRETGIKGALAIAALVLLAATAGAAGIHAVVALAGA